MRRPVSQRGVTLVEVAVSTVLTAVVLVAALETVGGSMRTYRATSEPIDAYALLAQMVAELQSAPYEDPDGNTVGLGIEPDEPATPADRLAFDDLDDFDDLVLSPPEDRDGTAAAGFTGWTQKFYVSYRDGDAISGLPATIARDEGVKRFRAELVSPSGVSYEIVGYRTPHGSTDEPAPFDAERVQSVAVEVQVGSADPVAAGVAVQNLAETP